MMDSPHPLNLLHNAHMLDYHTGHIHVVCVNLKTKTAGDLLQVCDEPHPLLIKEMLGYCVESKIDEAYQILKSLWDKGYSQHDIITNIFRVCKNHQMPEYLKLEFIKVKVLLHDTNKRGLFATNFKTQTFLINISIFVIFLNWEGNKGTPANKRSVHHNGTTTYILIPKSCEDYIHNNASHNMLPSMFPTMFPTKVDFLVQTSVWRYTEFCKLLTQWLPVLTYAISGLSYSV